MSSCALLRSPGQASGHLGVAAHVFGDCSLGPYCSLFGHSVVSDSVTTWTAARQASLSITICRSLLKQVHRVDDAIPPSHPLSSPSPPAPNPSQHQSLVVQSCPTLRDPMDCSPPGSSVHGISQARILEWVAISSSRGSSQRRDQTHVSCILCLGRWVLYPEPPRNSPER